MRMRMCRNDGGRLKKVGLQKVWSKFEGDWKSEIRDVDVMFVGIVAWL